MKSFILVSLCFYLVFQVVHTKVALNPAIDSYSSPDFEFSWGWTDNTQTAMWFSVSAPTKGWLAMGLQDIESDQMPGADVYVATVADDLSEAQVTDRWASEFATPAMDLQQDATVLDYDQTGENSWVLFSRPLDTGDSNDRVIEPGPITIIYAYGIEDVFDIHLVRSSFQVDLFSGVLPESPLGPQIGSYESEEYSFYWGWTEESGSAMWFNISAPTTGWVAMGLQDIESDEMPGADVYVVTVADDLSEADVTDRWATTFGTPAMDLQQDPEIVDFGQSDAGTWVLFVRDLDTGDADDRVIAPGPITLIYAYGLEDPFDIHVVRSSFQVDLFTGEIIEETLGEQIGSYSSSDFALTWGWVDTNQDAMWFTMSAPTTGWVGMGLQDIESDEMPGADIYVASVEDNDGDAYVKDCWADEFGTPPMDEQQDADVYGFEQTNDTTTVTFIRSVDTNDTSDRVIVDDYITIIYAYGLEDPFDIHVVRGSFQANLFNGHIVEERLGSAIGSFHNNDFGLVWGWVDKHKDAMWFNMSAPTTGWVGMGIQDIESDEMPGADIYVASVPDSLEDAYIKDCFSTEFAMPPMDEQQDAEVVAFDQTDHVTWVTWTRALDTNDKYDRTIKHKRQNTIIYAYGSEDVFDIHAVRGSFQVDLFSGEVIEEDDKWHGDRVGEWHTPDDDDFKIEWGFRDNKDTIVWKIRGKTKGWMGLGLGKDRYMPESDMIIMSVGDKSGEGVVADRWVNSYSTPVMDDSQDVEILSAKQHNGYTYMTIARACDTGDKKDWEIKDRDNYFLWALGDEDVFDIHLNKGANYVNWKKGDTHASNGSPIRWVHGLFMILAWGVLAILGPTIARYLKYVLGNAIWYYVHIMIMLGVTTLTIAAFIIIIIDTNNRNRPHFSNFHGVFGLLIMIFTLFQPLHTLFLRLPIIDRLLKIHRFHIVANFFHRKIGHGLVLAGLINIGTGINQYNAMGAAWYIYFFLLGTLVLGFLLYELFTALPKFERFVGKHPAKAQGEKELEHVKTYKLWSFSPLAILVLAYEILLMLIVTGLCIALIVVVSQTDVTG